MWQVKVYGRMAVVMSLQELVKFPQCHKPTPLYPTYLARETGVAILRHKVIKPANHLKYRFRFAMYTISC